MNIEKFSGLAVDDSELAEMLIKSDEMQEEHIYICDAAQKLLWAMQEFDEALSSVGIVRG